MGCQDVQVADLQPAIPSSRGFLLLAVLLAFLSLPGLVDHFAAQFTGRTLRVDYNHGGVAGGERISLDRIRLEGPWPGNRTQLLDETNLGKYFLAVVDAKTNRTIHSRGFSSIYGEWEATGEARKGILRGLHESQRFPEPRGHCRRVLRKRAPDGEERKRGAEPDSARLVGRVVVGCACCNGKMESQ